MSLPPEIIDQKYGEWYDAPVVVELRCGAQQAQCGKLVGSIRETSWGPMLRVDRIEAPPASIKEAIREAVTQGVRLPVAEDESPEDVRRQEQDVEAVLRAQVAADWYMGINHGRVRLLSHEPYDETDAAPKCRRHGLRPVSKDSLLRAYRRKERTLRV